MADQRPLAEQFGPYDEARMTGYTVMNYRRDLLTEKEHQIGIAFFARGKATIYENPAVENRIREKWKNLGDPEIDIALERGYPIFVQEVTERILRDHPNDLDLNRCPNCKKIVITPMAKWCMWCKHDWH